MKSEKSELIIITTLLLIFFTVMGLPKQHNNEKSCPESVKPEIIVSADWLIKHLNDKDLIILHVSPDITDYNKGHIPEARFLSQDLMIVSSPSLMVELPSIDKMTDVMNRIGISNTSKIILYGSAQNLVKVARIFVTFEYLGFKDHVSILDGGMEAWTVAGGQLSTQTPVIQESSFIPKINSEVFVSAEDVLYNIGSPDKTIIDMRPPEAYAGDPGQPRTGHIPGAINLSLMSFRDQKGKFLEQDGLQSIFTSAGINNKDLTLYCFVGQSACITYIAARVLNYPVHVYDGSFEEWSSRDDLPLEVSYIPSDLTIKTDSIKEKK